MKPASPSLSDVARQLLTEADAGVLATHSQGHEGFPFSSLVQFALDDAGQPIFLLSGLAEHTRNVRGNPKASLFVRELKSGEPQATARVTMLGEIELLPEDEIPPARDLYIARHPQATLWAGFGDFRWFRMVPTATYVVAGFGQMGWVRH